MYIFLYQLDKESDKRSEQQEQAATYSQNKRSEVKKTEQQKPIPSVLTKR